MTMFNNLGFNSGRFLGRRNLPRRLPPMVGISGGNGNDFINAGVINGGAQGVQGIQGIQGIQGVQGLQGPSDGPQGVQGIQGIQGITGIIGNQGLQGVQGIQGITGEQGIQGILGNQGVQGVQGVQGTQGITGDQGIQGTQGIQGVQGVQGIQGVQGVQGVQGTQGITGNQGIQGIIGNQGIQGIQGTVGGLVVPVTIANTSPYLALSTDYDIAVTANAVIPSSVVLPISPVGTVFIVKDAAGVASINAITISTIGFNIDGAATAVINTNYGSLTFIFNGLEWNIT
jgi:hypothetical protein